MSSADHSSSDAPNETSIRRKIFRKHVFNHQRRDLKTEFSEYQEQAGSGERRTDLERYVLVALAIGKSPYDPPQWALEECEKLYVRDASHQSSMTERVKSFEPDEALLDLVINILEAHPDNLAAFYSQNEDGGEFLPEDTKLSFKKHVPGPATEQTHPKEDEEGDDPSKAEDEESDDPSTAKNEEGDGPSKAEDEESDDPSTAKNEEGDDPSKAEDEESDDPSTAKNEEGDGPSKAEDEESDDPSTAKNEEGDDPSKAEDEESDDPSTAEDEEGDDPFKGLVDARLSTTAAMRDILSRSGEPVLHDDARLKLLQRRWRQTSRQDKQSLVWRAFHIAQFRRSGSVPRFRYSE